MEKIRLKRLAKEGTWVASGQTATVVGQLVLVRVLTEYLTPTQYGDLSLALTISTLVTQVIMGGLIAGIGRYYIIASEANDLKNYLIQSFGLLVLGTCATIIVGAIVITTLVLMGKTQWILLALSALLFAILSGYHGALNGIQNAARQRSIVAIHSGGNAWLKILMALVCLKLLGLTATSVITGYLITMLLVCVSQSHLLKTRITQHIEFKKEPQSWAHQIWAFSWPFSFWGIFTWAHQSSDRWSLHYFSSGADVGQYTVLFQLGYAPISIFTTMLITLIAPILYAKSGSANNPERNNQVNRLGWLLATTSLITTLSISLSTYFLHEWIFLYLVSRDYRSISHLFPLMILAGGIFASGQILALKIMSDLRPKRMTFSKVTTALLGVSFNIFGAFIAGTTGVVLAMCLFSILYFTWSAHIAREPPPTS